MRAGVMLRIFYESLSSVLKRKLLAVSFATDLNIEYRPDDKKACQ